MFSARKHVTNRIGIYKTLNDSKIGIVYNYALKK